MRKDNTLDDPMQGMMTMKEYNELADIADRVFGKMEDLDPRINKMVNDHFFELI